MPVEKVAARSLAGRVKSTAEAGKRPLLAAVVRPAAKPSRTLLASLDALDARVTSRVDVVQVDIDEAPDVMDAFRVSYEPELLLFENGRVVERTDGEMTADQIADLVEHALAPR